MKERPSPSGITEQAPSAVRYVLAAVLVPLALVAMVMWLRTAYRQSEALRAQVSKSYQRRVDNIMLLSRLKDAETAQRDYLLTGDPALLRPYEPARRDIDARLASAVAALDPDVAPRDLAAVAALVDAKFGEMDASIERRAGGKALARQTVQIASSPTPMDRLRVVIGGMIEREELRSREQQAAFVARRTRLQYVIWAVVGTMSLMLLAFLIILWRVRRQRYASLVEAFESAERNSTILNSTTDAILILNPSGTIEAVNATASAMLGYPSGQLERRDIATILNLAPGDGSFHQRIGLVDGQLRRAFLPDATVHDREGNALAVDVALGVMPVPSGVHLIVSLRDIAERKRIDRIKDDLMSTVSHELRTPLTSIVGSLGLLRAGAVGEMPADAVRLIEIAENNSRRLIRLINDMLDIDRIESGKLHLARAPIDLRVVIDQACVGSQGLAHSSDVEIICHSPDNPVMIAGDSDRLLQVVSNLISNAVRAAPEGSAVELSLALDGSGRALVTVDDSGAGIPPAFRERIFGRFERAMDNDGVGTGLGLAISREIVARHDGTIWFEDRNGGGTRFAFALPVLRTLADADDEAPRVLLCARDEAFAASLVALAVDEGCRYDVVKTLAEASDALVARHYVALLVDLDLSDPGGSSLVPLARDDLPVDVPLIVMSAGMPNDGDALSPLDVIDWIGKPVDFARLGRALRQALTRSIARRPVILHLDDDRDLLDVVAAALAAEAKIVAATDLPSAHAILEQMAPDAAILDIRLAEGSGLDLIPYLVDADGQAIPTIIYSAQDVTDELAARVDAVLVKARGSIPDLKATLRRMVRERFGPVPGE